MLPGAERVNYGQLHLCCSYKVVLVNKACDKTPRTYQNGKHKRCRVLVANENQLSIIKYLYRITKRLFRNQRKHFPNIERF